MHVMSDVIHLSDLVISVAALYSASALDIAIAGYSLLHPMMRARPTVIRGDTTHLKHYTSDYHTWTSQLNGPPLSSTIDKKPAQQFGKKNSKGLLESSAKNEATTLSHIQSRK